MHNWFPALLLLAELTAYGSDATRQADLNFVANQVPRLHANFFYQLDRAVFQAAADALATDLPNLSDAEFYDRLAALIAMAGDPHTAIYLNNSAAVTAGFQQFPLQFVSLDDGVFVNVASDPYARALGAQLTAVGGVPIDQVMQQMGTLIPHSNDGWLRYYSLSYLRGQQILQGLHIAPVGATTPLTFRTLAGETFTLDVAPGAMTSASALPDPNGGPYPRYLQGTNQNYWFVYEPANRMVYFRYNSCSDTPGNPFAAFAANLLATLDSNPVDTVVLDLRRNVGGNSVVWNPLLTGLTQRMPRLLTNSRFRIYGAVDNGTFSSGSLDAMLLKSTIPQVRIIGEATGGAAGGYGNVTQFTLPGSGLIGEYSTNYVQTPAGIAPGPTFAPDIAIGIRSTDFFARYDPVMGAILARTDQAPAAPSGDAIAVNGASFRAEQGLAPGSYAAVFGSFGQVPDGVLVAGIAAQIVFATATQVNLVVPASAAVGTASISVRAGGREMAAGQAAITDAGPGLFVLTADPWQPGAVENQDSSINSASNPAAVGSIVSIYATGAGPLDGSGNAPVSVFFGDEPAEVVASVPLSAYPGLWQINARVPALPLMGQIPVFAIAGGLASNAATVAVR
ncbi:MAG TPA: hypothetical protein VKU19_20220 [Bryobacteraceae bacterium]|nr:hypothetical protein [Bryobacteraceae bacterium]